MIIKQEYIATRQDVFKYYGRVQIKFGAQHTFCITCSVTNHLTQTWFWYEIKDTPLFFQIIRYFFKISTFRLFTVGNQHVKITILFIFETSFRQVFNLI